MSSVAFVKWVTFKLNNNLISNVFIQRNEGLAQYLRCRQHKSYRFVYYNKNAVCCF